jgi:hypothetical protein
MSWVISITAAPCWRHRPLQQRDDLRLHRDIERVVGSSAMTSSGLGGERERQHTRWRMPPRNW